MTRPQLVLDIGGVLATNLSPLFWQLIAGEAAVSEDTLYEAYKRQVSEQLWTGSLSEEQFWSWIKVQAPNIQVQQARSFIDRSLQPLPALEKIVEWSLIADIHLLSNHLPAWVEPIVNPINKYLKSITISSETGLRKPHPDIYRRVASHFAIDGVVLFVDDQHKNLKQAASLGWRTLLADEDGRWIPKVLPLLQNRSDKEEQYTAKGSCNE
ncbi:HAD family hydrolase [Paenibacillus prosopidis]|uniref:Putative hydrolase of the HAD superfamily n=1 Tax=Paenibacillus prosopidis TaxID=630520 RepID=A0A368W454_9BACL|nr:HAD-IA family hydrolase [Paenibacillus prosopidis]RCW50209.1 putative hydrolase of the HAD superfamily [Paenibacillus prosopidis]